MKTLVGRHIDAGEGLNFGLPYDGATILIEDGEARVVFDLKTCRYEIVR